MVHLHWHACKRQWGTKSGQARRPISNKKQVSNPCNCIPSGGKWNQRHYIILFSIAAFGSHTIKLPMANLQISGSAADSFLRSSWSRAADQLASWSQVKLRHTAVTLLLMGKQWKRKVNRQTTVGTSAQQPASSKPNDKSSRWRWIESPSELVRPLSSLVCVCVRALNSFDGVARR